MPKFRNPIVGGDVLLIPAIESSKQNLDNSGPAWSISTDGFSSFATMDVGSITGVTIDGFNSGITMFNGTFGQLTATTFKLGGKAVSVGAADSGGAGFRVLRVPN